MPEGNPHTVASPPRVDGIDVLRGLSVLGVVLHHIHLRFHLEGHDVKNLLNPTGMRLLFWSGYYSVIIFFVISGYLITSLSLQRWGALPAISLRQFYLLRFARIAPCLLALLALLSPLHLAGVGRFVIDPQRATLGRALFAALTMHVNWLEGRHGYLPGNWDVLWSLSVEELFYLGFPLCCVALRSEGRLLIPLCGLIVAGPLSRLLLSGQVPWEDYAYLSCMDGIAWGCVGALAAARLSRGKVWRRICLVLGANAAALVLLFRGLTASLGLSALGLNVSLLQTGIAAMMVGLASGSRCDALSRATAFVRVIGRCSYEIYLTHMFVVLGAGALVRLVGFDRSMVALWYLAELLGSIALGYVVARGFSAPANRFLRSRWPG